MPSLSSFINSSQYSTESTTIPLVAGLVAGTTYSTITFDGSCGAAGNDPGGLFGWLVYARTNFYSPAKGATTDKYIVYTNPQDLVRDLNKLSGITYCLISNPGDGGTFGFFETAGTVDDIVQLNALTPGKDFLHAINYLAYGGNLILAGDVSGFDQYTTQEQGYLDVLINQEAGETAAQWLITQPYTVGIFPSIADSSGITGGGYTMADYATLFADSNLITGSTVANRIFNVYGIKAVNNQNTSTLLSNSEISYTLPAVADVGGCFTRSKNRGEQNLSVAGVERATVLNGSITNTVDWSSSSLKTILRNNRVNFYVNYNPAFLGSDLVGATAGTTITADSRVGTSRLRSGLTQLLTNIGLKYLYTINNPITRAQITAEIQTGLDPYSAYIDTTQTQIICNASNNDDGSPNLTMELVVKPVLSVNDLVIAVTVTP